MAGGGVALIRAASACLDSIKVDNNDEKIGIEIIRKACDFPLRQIANNAGEEGAVVVQKVKSMKGNMGYDAVTGNYVDMLKVGIIDPTKVERAALQDAASVAGLLVTTECMITELPKKEAPAAPGGHGGVTFVASSGDGGAPVSYPAASANVLSVGGTTLIC